jgi:hypothetical protein
MSRRLLAVLIACCAVALSVTAVALASGGGSSPDKQTAAKQHHAPAKHRAIGGGLLGVALTSLAQRLDVAPADLRAAVKTIAQEQRAKHRGHARPTPEQLAALKTELATSLATKLDKTPDEVLTAVRAELDARLTQAVAAHWLTQKGHDLALACFDAPASCDLKALRAEVRFFGHHKKAPKPSSSSGGNTGITGGGQMTPGGRATSTPLR